MNRLKSINKELERIARENEEDEDKIEKTKLRENLANNGEVTDCLNRFEITGDLIIEELDN